MNETKMQTPMTLEDFQQIANKPLPTPDELLAPLNKFHSILYDAFGYSLVRTRDVLKDTQNRKSARMFRPHAIRFYVHDFLSQKGIKAQLIDEDDEPETNDEIFGSRVLANNGIAGHIRGYEFRILKIVNKRLPPPITKPRQEFYSQTHLKEYKPAFPGFYDGNTKKTHLKPHLVYLWDIVHGRINIYLAIPKHYLLYAETKITLIPNPITAIKQKVAEEETEIKKENVEVVDNK
jgi:hypothetical protein